MSTTDISKFLHGDAYHVGIVVDDVAEAMALYGPLFGVEWGVRMDGAEFPVQLRDETRLLRFDAVYSKPGPLRIELTVAKPGTIWKAGSGIHHLGFWSDDVVAESNALAEAGYPIEALLFPIPDSDVPSVAFCRGPQDIFLEIVSSDMRAYLEQAWA